MGMILEVKNVSCGYRLHPPVVEHLSLTVNTGEIWCILGPNGVGKTTFFKSLLGFLRLKSGVIKIDGEDIGNWNRKKMARVIGYVPQAQTNPFPFTVEDVVLMGRTPYLNVLSAPSAKDIAVAERTIQMLGIAHLKNKQYTELSGGERQMVLIARALTQEPEILIMDEPTSNLDFGNQVRVLRHVCRLSENGLTILMTSHFPDHAFICNAKVVLFQPHRFVVGNAQEIVTERSLREAYGVDVKIVTDDADAGHPIKSCVPLLSESIK